MINIAKRKALMISLILISLSFQKDNELNKPNIEIMENSNYFGKYSKGKIYIGDINFLKALNNKENGDVLVLDARDSKDDPCLKILDSSSIIDEKDRDDIIKVLCRYEELFPSDWKRSFDSMKIEWYVHNLLYYLNIERDRTKDVDLNNADEEMYNNKVLKKVLKV